MCAGGGTARRGPVASKPQSAWDLVQMTRKKGELPIRHTRDLPSVEKNLDKAIRLRGVFWPGDDVVDLNTFLKLGSAQAAGRTQHFQLSTWSRKAGKDSFSEYSLCQ